VKLSDRDLIRLLAKYLKAEAPTSQAAQILHHQLGPKLTRILAGAAPNSVLKTAGRGRPVSDPKQAYQNVIAGFIALRRAEGCTKKEAAGQAARILKISDDDVLNANRAPHDVVMKGSAFAVLAEMSGKTPEQMLKAAFRSQVSTAKKTARTKPRGK